MPPPDRTVTLKYSNKVPSCGISIIFILQVVSAVAFSMISSLLILYLLSVFHMPQSRAYGLVAAYNALGYATSILGGYLAERFLGYRFSVLMSSLLGGVGLAIITVPNFFCLYLGLACFSLSYGVMIPAIFVLVGRLKSSSDHTKRDGNFILAYIGMDGGAFVAALSSGYISTYFSYSLAFAIGAACLFITLIIFFCFRKNFTASTEQLEKQYFFKNKWCSRVAGFFILLLCIPVLLLLLGHANFCNILLIAMGVGCAGFIIYLASQQKNAYSGKLIVFLVLLTISTIFDASYFLSPSALTVFTDSNIDKHIFGIAVPTAAYSALNPLFVISMGPLISRLWTWLDRHGNMPSLSTRFAIGILLMGCGYLVLMYGAGHSNSQHLVSACWLAGGYFLQTMGELFISPAGYAMVGVLVPVSLEGIMMGISQFSSGVAGALSEFLANWISPSEGNLTKELTNLWYQHAFGYLGLSALVLGLIIFCVAPYLTKLGTRSLHHKTIFGG